MCGNIQCMNNNNNNDINCLICESQFVVKMNLINHIILGMLIGMQSILGSLMIDIIIKSYSYKLIELYQTRKDKKLLIWLQRFGAFIFAFAVTFYYLLLV
eukprot:15616_1